MTEDAVAATLAALNQRIKALTAAIRDLNDTLAKGTDDDTGKSES